jgi:hypothetical protein
MRDGATSVRPQQARCPIVMPISALDPGIKPNIPTTTGTQLDPRIMSGDDETTGTMNAETAR